MSELETQRLNKITTLNELEEALSSLELKIFNEIESCRFYNYFKKKKLIKEMKAVRLQRSIYKTQRVKIRKGIE